MLFQRVKIHDENASESWHGVTKVGQLVSWAGGWLLRWATERGSDTTAKSLDYPYQGADDMLN